MLNDTRPLPVRTDRALADLEALRDFGRCGHGVVRRAFSEADVQSRTWLARRMEEAGLEAHIDAQGNVFGIPPGEGPMLLLGSHSDTQPEGGWLDGAYGVIAALEVARASREANGPRIAVVSFQDEEGRFGALTGSRVWSGALSQEEADKAIDDEGNSYGGLRQKRGDWPAPSEVSPSLFSGYVEIHIEQGPFLDDAKQQVGVVDRIVGIRGKNFTFTGEQNHAGTTPMYARRDAFQGLVKFASLINERLAKVTNPASVWTIGQVNVSPNASSIVPGCVTFSMQWRDGDVAVLDAMETIINDTAAEVAASMSLALESNGYHDIAPTISDASYVAALEAAAEELIPGKWRTMTSGALHDAANMTRHMPMAMLFVPSIKGISHNFDEDTDIADLHVGIEVLAAGVSRITGAA